METDYKESVAICLSMFWKIIGLDPSLWARIRHGVICVVYNEYGTFPGYKTLHVPRGHSCIASLAFEDTMKLTVLSALITLVPFVTAATIPFMGGVNTAGYDFSVVCPV